MDSRVRGDDEENSGRLSGTTKSYTPAIITYLISTYSSMP